MGSSDVYVVAGQGFSCVPKTARAAWQYLYALEMAEEQQRVDPLQRHNANDDIDANEAADEDARTAEAINSRTQQPDEDEDKVEEIVVGESWVPSAELLARQPDILRIPLELEGSWCSSTSKLVLSQKHTFGCNHEIMYHGTCTVSTDARVLTLQMRCAFAEAFLPLTLMAAESSVAAVSTPQLHDFHLA